MIEHLTLAWKVKEERARDSAQSWMCCCTYYVLTDKWNCYKIVTPLVNMEEYVNEDVATFELADKSTLYVNRTHRIESRYNISPVEITNTIRAQIVKTLLRYNKTLEST